MSHTEELERAKNQLSEIRTDISMQVNQDVLKEMRGDRKGLIFMDNARYRQGVILREQKMGELEARKEVLRDLYEQVRKEGGYFAPENEMDAYLLTQLKLEEDVARLEKMCGGDKVPVTGSARRDPEPPTETPVKKRGVFSAIKKWVSGLFRSKKTEQQEAQPVQKQKESVQQTAQKQAAPVKKEKTTTKREKNIIPEDALSVPVDMRAYQSSANGCWSVSLSMLLRARGVELSQEEIRRYRPGLNPLYSEANDDYAKLMRRLDNDGVNQILDLADIVMEHLPNHSLHEVQFSGSTGGDQIMEEITKGLQAGSPVSILYKNHYRTIVAIKGDTVYYKDSLRTHHSLKGGPEDVLTMTVGEIKKKAGNSEIQLTYLKPVNHENPEETPGVFYVDGQAEYVEDEGRGASFHAHGMAVERFELSESGDESGGGGVYRTAYYPKWVGGVNP